MTTKSTSDTSTTRLHINIDHVATLRNARGAGYPDPVRAAEECLSAGADGITAHLREDRRHIRDPDVVALSDLLRRSRRTFNLEMAATKEMVEIALRIRPDVCTLVPERRQEQTTEGGLDVRGGGQPLRDQVRALLSAGLRVSLFIEPDPMQIEASRSLGVAQVELHTGEYAHGRPGEIARLAQGARLARDGSLEVAAGHGLNLDNVGAVAALPEIVELNIGHAVVADAIFLGISGAVRAYRQALSSS